MALISLRPELEEELAAEAERGYDLSKARRHVRTRPLLPGSPALDNGSNIHDFAFDQRGHVRSFGLGPDIGAFEAGVDAIFEDGFD